MIMNVSALRAWAICDTDGGRQAPRPLLRHVYATEALARQAAAHFGFELGFYPVMAVMINPVESKSNE